MQAKKKLTALLLSLCMVLGVLPMTAFAAGAPAAPGDLKREWTNSGLKVSWSQPEPIGELEIFEYEVSLFVDENLKEKETVRQATDYTFKTFGDLTEPTNFRVEVKAREAISGTGDRGNPASFDVTEWTEWSSASKETFVEDDSIKVNTEIIKHYTGVVDVALPGSDQKLYKEGIEAADDADIEAIMDLLYAYFEENKATVPELADVAKADLTTEMVLTRIESSRTVGSINTDTEGRPVVVVHEVVDKCYTLYLEFNPETDDRPSRPSHSSGGSTGGIGSPLPMAGEGSSTPSVTGFESDTKADLTVDGRYQFRITSLDSHTPVLTVNNSNFTVTLASRNGRDYFYVITCAGTPGSTAAVSVDGKYLLTATVGGSASGVVSDTTHPFTVAQGGTYQFRLTAAARPSFAAGSASFTVEYAGQEGNDWFYKVHAVGQVGDGCGFYINGEAQPVAVATIA